MQHANTEIRIELSTYIKLVVEESDYSISTEEKYLLKGKRTILQLQTWAVNKSDKTKKYLLDKRDIKLPKSIPTWMTKNNLWNHTDWELLQLRKLAKRKGEKNPSNETIESWKKNYVLKELT